MPQRFSEMILPLPRWLMIVVSVAILLHFIAIGGRVLSAQSGPWAMQFGTSQAVAPEFAQEIDRVANPAYLRPLRMTHDYHFLSNHPETPGVFFEAVLRDESGKVMKTLKFPDADANFWLRHRQLLLARGLADDMPVQAPQGEAIAAPNRLAPSLEIWEPGDGKVLKVRTIPEHLVPRDHPVFRPSEWSRLLARAYGRYLCRAHGAASAEILRHTKEPLLSGVLLSEEAPNPEELVATFGEVKR